MEEVNLLAEQLNCRLKVARWQTFLMRKPITRSICAIDEPLSQAASSGFASAGSCIQETNENVLPLISPLKELDPLVSPLLVAEASNGQSFSSVEEWVAFGIWYFLVLMFRNSTILAFDLFGTWHFWIGIFVPVVFDWHIRTQIDELNLATKNINVVDCRG